MNADQFSGALNALVNQALSRQQMDLLQLVGALEMAKLDVVRVMQDRAREKQSPILKANRMPNGNS